MIALCFYSSIKGNYSQAINASNLVSCSNNPVACDSSEFESWVKLIDCSDNRLFAAPIIENTPDTTEKFELSEACPNHTIGTHIRVVGTFSDNGIFLVRKLESPTFEHQAIQIIKYAVSLLGLLLTLIFVYKENKPLASQ